MYQQTGLLFHRFRFVFASLLTVAFLVCISDMVTAIGSNSVLNPKSHSSAATFDTNFSDSPDVLTTGLYSLTDDLQRALLATGTTLYKTCRSVTVISSQSGKAVTHGTVATVQGIGHGIAFGGHLVGSSVAFAGRGVGGGVLFVVRTPGKIVGSVTSGSGHAVSSVIQPSSDDTAAVPVITAPSAAELASMTLQEQQQVASDQAAQIAANQKLGGVIVAGDPTRGGYPAQWDNARQDSMLDSWGMYNRECVSYAAWKVYQTYGTMPYWGGVGNANEWPGDARRAGIPTGSTPQVHSVAISLHGYYGHAMWVEKVSGNMIYVSQYNYDLHGHYSEMWVDGSDFTYIYFK